MADAESGDYISALKEWRPLAAKGHADAQYNIGFLYEEGRGVPLDTVESAKWYRKAAELGHTQAQRSLGMKYEYGQGVPQDKVLALMWLRISAAGGNKYAARSRNRIRKNMPPAQVTKARKLARDWRRKHKKN